MKQTNRTKTPWPTNAVMSQIYEQNLWGGNPSEFYSGEGSHDPTIVHPYIDVVSSFLKSFDEPLTVCDLGCGDFNVGIKLVEFAKHYHAVDIVPALIERNRSLFQADNLSFHCLDVAVDELPKGDCALVRQVLQHLSNDEVGSILQKLSNFNYVIITEHLPLEYFIPNKDKISGQGIRLKQQSGIDVLAEPFNWEVFSSKELISIKLENGKGRIVTTLYQVF
jgi:SAM-dependent methyltransferase